MHARYAVTIDRGPEELYEVWRHLENLPLFMHHLESVNEISSNGSASGGQLSHWIAKGPGGSKVEWDAEIIDDRPAELIAWRSVGEATVANSGEVRFFPEPGGRGTIVAVQMTYDPPGGMLGAGIAKLFGQEPEGQLKNDLRRFKQYMEIGEIVTTEGQSAGRESSTSRKYDSVVETAAAGRERA